MKKNDGGFVVTNMSKERQLLKSILSPTPECATPAQLERLSAPDAVLWAHVSSCTRCQAERALLHEFEAAGPQPHEEGPVGWISRRLEQRFSTSEQITPRNLTDPWWKRMFTIRAFNTGGLVFATAMVAIALVVGLGGGRRPALTAPANDAATLRSGELDVISPMGDLRMAPDALRWRPVANARSYSVQVMEVDHAQVWSADTGSTSAELPSQVAAQIVPGKSLIWQVTAKDGSGSIVAQSAVQRFRLRPANR